MRKINILFSLVRVTLGFIFFWAFIDKLLGLGFATTSEKSWLQGVSPTAGFLQFGTHGVFAPFFHMIAGNLIVDWLFMGGLLGIGIALLLGIGMKIAGYSGAILVTLMYLSLVPSENNPLVDEHIVYFFIFLIFTTGEIGTRFSLSNSWKNTPLVKKYPMLQ